MVFRLTHPSEYSKDGLTWPKNLGNLQKLRPIMTVCYSAHFHQGFITASIWRGPSEKGSVSSQGLCQSNGRDPHFVQQAAFVHSMRSSRPVVPLTPLSAFRTKSRREPKAYRDQGLKAHRTKLCSAGATSDAVKDEGSITRQL